MTLEAEIKIFIDENRQHQKLRQQFDVKESAYKKYITTLKTQLNEGIKKQYEEKEDQCQRIEDELKNKNSQLQEATKIDATIKELRDRTNYCVGLETTNMSLKSVLENSNKQNEELFQVFE